MHKNKIFTGVDQVKLFSAIGVVAIHTSLPFFNVLGRLGVPFFAIVSSFFFFRKFNRVKEWSAQKNILLEFCRRIFLLYITWQCIYVPFAILNIKKFIDKFGTIDFKKIITCVIYFVFPALYNSKGVNVTSELNGWGPSWYLLATMVGIPLFVLFLKMFNYNKLIIGVICFFLESYFVMANEFGFIDHISPLPTHTFLRLFTYFFIGYIFALYSSKIYFDGKKYILLLVFLLVLSLFILENLIVHYVGGSYTSEEVIMTVPTSIVLALVAFNWNPRILNSVYIRNLSTFLYCVQVWPIKVIGKIMSMFSLSDMHLILFIAVMAVSLILYYIYTVLLNKHRQSVLRFMI